MQLLLAAALLISVCPAALVESDTTASLPGPDAESLRALPGVHSVVVRLLNPKVSKVPGTEV